MMIRALVVLLILTASMSAKAQAALQPPPKASALGPAHPALPHRTLDRIRSALAVTCAVVKEEEDYSRSTDHGNRAAFDIDLCKAVAVAALGSGANLVIKSFPDEPFALRALRAGEVDLVATASLSAITMTEDVAFSPPVLLDGQSMLVPKRSKVQSAAQLAGKRVCFLTGSAAEEGLHSYAEEQRLSYVWYPFSEAGEMEAAFFTGNCDAVTGDLTQLANIRGIDPRRASEFEILPGTFRDDPLALAVWAGDPAFHALVYWTAELLLQAERMSITQDKVKLLQSSRKAEVQELFGRGPGIATALKTRPGWGAEVIQAVGNYGEIFDRDLGMQSGMHLERDKNRLTTQGGELYAIPVRDR